MDIDEERHLWSDMFRKKILDTRKAFVKGLQLPQNSLVVSCGLMTLLVVTASAEDPVGC